MTNTTTMTLKNKGKSSTSSTTLQAQHRTSSTILTTASPHQQHGPVSITSSVPHHISLHAVNIEDEFDIVKTLAEGCFAKLILVKKGVDKMVLKAIHSEVSTEADFRRELNYNYFLSPHPNIVTSYNVSFLWDNCYVFVQEYAPFGDLSRFVKKGGLPAESVKLIASQLSNALDFMHGLHLVHRDLKLENILVFKTNFSVIKLCDFGYTYAEGSLVAKTNQTWIPFSPPEICQIVLQEKYYCHSSSDVWQVGIIIYICLTGDEPWSIADITDANFCQYTDWLRRRSLRMPESFAGFTPRFIRLLKRLLEPKPSKRYEIREIMKYLNDKWLRTSSKSSTTPGTGDHNSHLLLLDRKESMNTTSQSSHRQNKSTTPGIMNENDSSVNGGQGDGLLHPHPHLNRSSPNNRSSRTNRSAGIRHTRSRSCRKSLKVYGIETEIDKNLISERVFNWISNNNNNSVPSGPEE